MAKAILKYNLADSDDSVEFERATKALDMALVLWEIAYNAKKKLYNEIEFDKIESPYEAIDKFYEKFWQEMNDHGINIDKLVV